MLSSPVLTLNGWVAFNLPRTVTALGGSLLLGIVAVHVYVSITRQPLPLYFLVYVMALTVGCLAAASAMAFGVKPSVPQWGWYLGSVVSVVFLGIYLASRFVGLPGLEALTGRWDVAPGTLAMAFAAGFIGLHTSVLSGINVAYPQRQGWHD
jgi:hypothetical protein